jgi:hypothetical protein
MNPERQLLERVTYYSVIPDTTFLQIFDLERKVRDPESRAAARGEDGLDSGSQGSLAGPES